jgi:LuxR family maltose regulon positive regulatory protein
MEKVDLLISTKLRPPFTRRELVPRPRLQARVTEGLCRPLTLITAPAGFGKTTLVVSCIAQCEMPVAWLSIDRDDNQAGRFLKYLVAALRGADPTIGREATQLAASPNVPPEAVLTHLVNDLECASTDIAVVLDDYQFISNQAVHEAVTFLLDHCPKTLHLVIAARSDPPLSLARLRARGQLVELRTADLRFTASEATQFLNDTMGLRVGEEAIAVLEDRTEGWIAGLQMAAISMQGREDVAGLIQGFAGTHRFIMDYLLEEVLDREPEDVQAFLLQTSILARLTGSLCDSVTGGSGGQEMLERLEHRNLFLVPLDDERRWYRYHHLFADLLQARLHKSASNQVERLLSRAAEWCAREGQVAEAIGYALAAQDYDQAASLIARHWHHAANRGEIETVWSWLNALPESSVRESAPLGLAFCWVVWLTGQVGAIEPHLADAENALDEQAVADFPDLPAHLTAMRSIVARHNNDYGAAVAFAERALHLAPEDLPLQAEAQLRTVIYLALASAYDGLGNLERAVDALGETIHWSRLGENPAGVAGMTNWLVGVLWVLGRLRAADKACRDALSYLQERGMDRLPVAGVLHLRMSEVLLERNELEAAQASLSQGIELAKWSGRFDAVRNAARALVRLRLARGDTSGALAAVEEAESALGEKPSSLRQAGLLALNAGILVCQGAVREAAECVEEANRLAARDRGQIGEKVALATFKVMLAQDKLDEAIAELARSITNAEKDGLLGAAIELRILRSVARARRGDAQEALADLDRALAQAEPEGYVRIFLDEGQPMHILLTQWRAQADDGRLRDYAMHLLAQFDAEPHRIAPAEGKAVPIGALVEPLSERELEVLHLIALGLTNKEIAQQLFIAPGTVKAHTSTIYRKLDVANRTEAAARARQLGLL